MFDYVCRRRKLMVTVNKSKIVYERCKRDVIYIDCPYKVKMESNIYIQ